MGYAGFDAVGGGGGCNQVRHDGPPIGAKYTKLSCWSSVLVNEMQGSLFLDGGHLIGVGLTGFEAAGGCNHVRHDWGPFGPKKLKLSHQGLVFANKIHGVVFTDIKRQIGVGYIGFEVV